MDTWDEIWTNDFYRKLILTVLVLLIQAEIRHSLLCYVINQISDDSPHILCSQSIHLHCHNRNCFIAVRNLDTAAG
jgi:hypothetical protein